MNHRKEKPSDHLPKREKIAWGLGRFSEQIASTGLFVPIYIEHRFRNELRSSQLGRRHPAFLRHGFHSAMFVHWVQHYGRPVAAAIAPDQGRNLHVRRLPWHNDTEIKEDILLLG